MENMTVTGWPLPEFDDPMQVPVHLSSLMHAVQKGTVLVTDQFSNLDAKLAADNPPITGSDKAGLVAYKLGSDELAVHDGTAWQVWYKGANLAGNLVARTAGQYAKVDNVTVAKLPRGRSHGSGGYDAQVSDGGGFGSTESVMHSITHSMAAPGPRNITSMAGVRLNVTVADTAITLRVRIGDKSGPVLGFSNVDLPRAGYNEVAWVEEFAMSKSDTWVLTCERTSGSGVLSLKAGSRWYLSDNGATT